MPKLLWERGDAAPGTSESALRLLLDTGRTSPPGSALAAALTAVQPQVVTPTSLPSCPEKSDVREAPSSMHLAWRGTAAVSPRQVDKADKRQSCLRHGDEQSSAVV